MPQRFGFRFFPSQDVGDLALDRVPWEGGPAYWTVAANGNKMAKADEAGWGSDAFFPIAVFLGKPEVGHPAALAALGINIYMAVEHNPPISQVTNEGIFVLANINLAETGWSQAEIGNDPNVVGWFIADECDQGEAPCVWADDNVKLANFQSWCSTVRGWDDGRFLWANWGNGILRSFWSEEGTIMADFVQSVDGSSVDKYAYTSPGVDFEIGRSDDWPGTEPQAASSAAYGWMMDQYQWFQDPDNLRPKWGFYETKMPFLGETDARVISYDQLEGAVWSSICHEARGVAYFQNNGFYNGPPDPGPGPACGSTYSLVDCELGLKNRVTEINGRLTELAPILNTQSYVFDFGAAGIDAMLKAKDGFAYIFASVGIGAATGNKTFTLTGSGITGTTVEVLYESRNVSVSGGQFTDNFAAEYSHHIYKVEI